MARAKKEKIEYIVGKLLAKKKFTLAIAESCTGGLISNKITDVPGSSSYFLMGVISYSNESKNKILNVSGPLLKRYGAVSSQVAKAMATGVRKISKSDIGLSTTGIAGPTGATTYKPVGLVYIGLSYKKHTIVKKYIFKGTRTAIKFKTYLSALNLLHKYLKK